MGSASVGHQGGNGIPLGSCHRFRSRSHRLELSYDGECEILNPGEYLMEIKVSDAYPMWLANLLGELMIYPISFSKYGTAYGHLAEYKRDRLAENEMGREEKQICFQVY